MTGRKKGPPTGRDEALEILDLLAHDIGNSAQTAIAMIEMSSMGKGAQAVPPDLGLRVEAMHSTVCHVRTALRARRIPFHPKEIDIGEAVASAIRIAHRATGSRPAVEVMLPEGGCSAAADAMLEEALGEMIVNSVRHGGPTDRIEIRAERVRDAVRIVHEDRAKGVDLEVIEGSMHRFEGLLSGGGHHGSGTGLAMVKAVVDRYGGSVVVGHRSKGDPDSGLRIVIEVPSAHP